MKEIGLTTGATADGQLAAAIANLVVKTLSDYTGRGPTKARAYVNEDVISVVLRGSLTKGELSLARAGKDELVLSGRLAFQQTMRDDLVTGVQELTGRKVEAFLSDHHVDPDVGVQTFVLAPRSEPFSGNADDPAGEATAG